MPVSLLAQPSTSLIRTPDGKHHRTILPETWKKLLRLMRDVKPEGFKVSFSCPTCDAPITLTVPSPSSPRLECRCTAWIGR